MYTIPNIGQLNEHFNEYIDTSGLRPPARGRGVVQDLDLQCMLGSQEEQYRKDLCGHPARRPHLSIHRHQLAVRPKPSSSLGPGVIETISSIAWSSVLLPLVPETRPAEQPAPCSGPESSLLSTLCRDEGSVTQLITQARGESMT
ncbi:hypothetical protein WDU94_012362 [Cyamophila willieti]